jgi:hypothetical protein
MRRTATIKSQTGEQLTNFNFDIQIQTPDSTPGGAQEWYVEARGQGGQGSTVAWGESTDSFAVRQMPSGVSYAGVASLRQAQISFHFTLKEEGGTEISVQPPTNYILTCSNPSSALKQGSLPGDRPGCTDEPLVLQLTERLRASTYSFAVAVDLPASKPTPNNFNLVIRDTTKDVVDANYGLAGYDLVKVPVLSPTLAWSRADPGQTSIITMGITFTSDYDKVKAILFTWPPNKFVHQIRKPTDVQNLNRRFPVAASQSDGWAKWYQTHLRIDMDDTNDNTVITADTYSWSFPVLVPVDVMPEINVWYFSLCDDRSCQPLPDGSWRGTIINFPMQGFKFGEVSDGGSQTKASDARQRILSHGAAFASCLLVALSAVVAAS